MIDTPATVLVADDDRTIRRNLVLLLQAEGYRTIDATDGDEALAKIRTGNPDAVLLDLKMPGRDGLEVLAALGPALVDLPVIVVTAYGGSAPAIEAMRRGAYDYLTKPFDLDEVRLTLKRALLQRALAFEVEALRAEKRAEAGDAKDEPPCAEPELIGQSAAMREVFKAIGRAAATDAAVLIVGQSGTGKELVAHALHRHWDRAAGPFIRVNCGALPEGLVESELFGHERGAFTGADRQKLGRFERAEAAPSFSTKSASCRFRHRPRSCASSSRANSSASAGPRRFTPTPESSRPRTATCPGRLPPAVSARISSTASTSRGS